MVSNHNPISPLADKYGFSYTHKFRARIDKTEEAVEKLTFKNLNERGYVDEQIIRENGIIGKTTRMAIPRMFKKIQKRYYSMLLLEYSNTVGYILREVPSAS